MKASEIKKLANDIWEADNVYVEFTTEQINEKLFKMGLKDKYGVFLCNLPFHLEKICEKYLTKLDNNLVDLICDFKRIIVFMMSTHYNLINPSKIVDSERTTMSLIYFSILNFDNFDKREGK